MVEELRDVLRTASERGTHAGGEEVLRRSLDELGTAPRRRVAVAARLVAAATVVVVGVVGGTLLYGRAKLGDIDRVPLRGELLGSAAASAPMNVLVIGSDTRAGLDRTDEGRFGSADEVGSERADTIMVVHLDPDRGEAALLSLPRDLFVPIDGGRSQRINSALAGGPGSMVRTVQALLGIELDHYVQVDFAGFRRMVDALGGVTVRFDAPVRDRVSGLDVRAAGCRDLDGAAALALVRSRHLQVLEHGRWRSDPTGDLGRIARQQDFLLAALGDAATTRNPLTVARLLDAAADHVTIDDGLSSRELVELGRDIASIDAAHVRSVGLPTTPARVNGGAVLTAEPGALSSAGAALTTAARSASPAATAGVAGNSTGDRSCRR